MKKLIPLLLLLLSPAAFAVNPALGIHNLSAFLSGAASYTSATGFTSQTTGSSFVVFVLQPSATPTPSVSDNKSNTYSLISLGSGTNPIEEAFDAKYEFAYACLNCAGGTNHEVTVTTSGVLAYVEFVEITNTSAIDVSASAYSASPLNISVTPTVANDFILAMGMTANYTAVIVPTTGWTALDSGNNGTTSYASGSGYLAGATTSAQNAAMSGSSPLAGFTLAFKPTGGGSSCTHSGWNIATGAFSTPTAGSGTFWLKTGAKGSTDCSTTQYWQSSGAFGAN